MVLFSIAALLFHNNFFLPSSALLLLLIHCIGYLCFYEAVAGLWFSHRKLVARKVFSIFHFSAFNPICAFPFHLQAVRKTTTVKLLLFGSGFDAGGARHLTSLFRVGIVIFMKSRNFSTFFSWIVYVVWVLRFSWVLLQVWNWLHGTFFPTLLHSLRCTQIIKMRWNLVR